MSKCLKRKQSSNTYVNYSKPKPRSTKHLIVKVNAKLKKRSPKHMQKRIKDKTKQLKNCRTLCSRKLQIKWPNKLQKVKL